MTPRPTYILLGPPGAGKSTYSKLIAEHTGYTRIGSGAIIRAFCANTKNKELCEKMERDYAAGIPQSDEITTRLIGEELDRSDESLGFIFDAFPLSIGQVNFLESVLQTYNLAEPKVFYIHASEETVLGRIATRLVERDGKLTRRVDDTPEVVSKRYRDYEKRLAPIIDFYKSKNILIEIDGEPPVEQVWSIIQKEL